MPKGEPGQKTDFSSIHFEKSDLSFPTCGLSMGPFTPELILPLPEVLWGGDSSLLERKARASRLPGAAAKEGEARGWCHTPPSPSVFLSVGSLRLQETQGDKKTVENGTQEVCGFGD